MVRATFSSLCVQEGIPQAAQQLSLLFGGDMKTVKLILCQKSLSATNERLGDHFEQRSGSNLNKAGEIRPGTPGTAFGEIAGNRYRRASHLIGQSKPFVRREIGSQFMDLIGKRDGFLPHFELFKIKHVVLRVVSVNLQPF